MVVMSGDFAAALAPDLGQRLDDPLGTAHDFAAAIGLFRRKPVIGVVHRFSSHALMLRYWLASAGIDPDRDVVLRVLPPSLMVEATRAGEIDGFIAGEPWGSVAVKGGLAEAVAIGERIWRRGIEIGWCAPWRLRRRGVTLPTTMPLWPPSWPGRTMSISRATWSSAP
jgi:two-component system, oxyanion-binding sensor